MPMTFEQYWRDARDGCSDDRAQEEMLRAWAKDAWDHASKALLPEGRDAVIRECWDAIDAKIERGDLGGSGWDKNAQRNGMVLAANILAEMMGWPKARYAEDSASPQSPK